MCAAQIAYRSVQRFLQILSVAGCARFIDELAYGPYAAADFFAPLVPEYSFPPFFYIPPPATALAPMDYSDLASMFNFNPIDTPVDIPIPVPVPIDVPVPVPAG